MPCTSPQAFLAWYLAYYLVRHDPTFPGASNDRSARAQDATLLWIPQTLVAFGSDRAGDLLPALPDRLPGDGRRPDAVRHGRNRATRTGGGRWKNSSSRLTFLFIGVTVLPAGLRHLGGAEPDRRGGLFHRHAALHDAARSATPWPPPSGRPTSSWTLTALPLFIWMGEILFRTQAVGEPVPRPDALDAAPARRPAARQHRRLAIFAAISGSSAATVATVGKMSIPELRKRAYPERMIIGTLAGAGTLGLLIPPSITLIIYGVTVNESIAKLFIAGILPGIVPGPDVHGLLSRSGPSSAAANQAQAQSYSLVEKLRAALAASARHHPDPGGHGIDLPGAGHRDRGRGPRRGRGAGALGPAGLAQPGQLYRKACWARPGPRP